MIIKIIINKIVQVIRLSYDRIDYMIVYMIVIYIIIKGVNLALNCFWRKNEQNGDDISDSEKH